LLLNEVHMRQLRMLLTAAVALLAACGSTGEGGALDCSHGQPYAGAAPHAPLAADAFPPPEPDGPDRSPLPEALADRLARRVDALLQQTGAPAFAVAIDSPGLGRWSTTRGLARVSPERLATDATWFYWASVAKSLTAVLVLQLVDEGRLGLDDRLANWYPQVPHAELITVRQLLTHTSGLATNAAPPASGTGTPEARLAAVAATPAVACPGTVASYSNVGYELLGGIVERVEGEAFHEVLARRIAQPLGLLQLRALRPGEEEVDALATPHLARQPTPDPQAWLRTGSGNVIAGAPDLLAAWRAVLAGRLLRPATVAAQWSVLYPIADGAEATPRTAGSWFGQGVMRMEWVDPSGAARGWLGHLGGTPGSSAMVAYDARAQAWVAVAVNSEVSAAAVANALLEVVLDWKASHPAASGPSARQGRTPRSGA
jgi:D-alanyl-D-alanine carboxypeptidase